MIISQRNFRSHCLLVCLVLNCIKWLGEHVALPCTFLKTGSREKSASQWKLYLSWRERRNCLAGSTFCLLRKVSFSLTFPCLETRLVMVKAFHFAWRGFERIKLVCPKKVIGLENKSFSPRKGDLFRAMSTALQKQCGTETTKNAHYTLPHPCASLTERACYFVNLIFNLWENF